LARIQSNGRIGSRGPVGQDPVGQYVRIQRSSRPGSRGPKIGQDQDGQCAMIQTTSIRIQRNKQTRILRASRAGFIGPVGHGPEGQLARIQRIGRSGFKGQVNQDPGDR
jgi:hypothetical protein